MQGILEKKTLHIISLDVPYPPTRGNTIGIFYRIKALHEAGVDIILHAFYKKFVLPGALINYCKIIHHYRRQPLWKAHDLHHPLFVQSRRSAALVELLAQDNHPILFEGLHTTFHFNDAKLKDRRKFIRMHNMESRYYGHLADHASNLFKKWYYRFESITSKTIERDVLSKANQVFAISLNEQEYLQTLGISSTLVLPFIDPIIKSKPGLGTYALYHGDLSIYENERAAIYLMDQVFDDLAVPLIIAGHNPSTALIKRARSNSKIKLIISPDPEKMYELLSEAQIVLAPFGQNTGYKMKLLESLTKSRHIITSTIMSTAKELVPALQYADENPHSWKLLIRQLWQLPFTQKDIDLRIKILEQEFNPQINAEKILKIIFP